MIDNSSSMTDAQNRLLQTFPGIMNVLKELPGGLPDLHVAVISQDMGAGVGIQNCVNFGHNAEFQYTARAPCTATTLQNGATFIVDSGGAKNYTAPDISDVFTCIAALGAERCGLEQQLAVNQHARWGRTASFPPAENQGFLRPDAVLAIVMITNEDDCSARQGANSALFGTQPPTPSRVRSVQPASFRCNEFGHLCNGVAPPRDAPTGSVTDRVPLQNCVSNEASPYLTPVATLVSQIKSLKIDPSNQILVFALAGAATPYAVRWSPGANHHRGPGRSSSRRVAPTPPA